MNPRELMQTRAAKLAEAQQIAAEPDLNDEKRAKFDALMREHDALTEDIKRAEKLAEAAGTAAAGGAVRAGAPNLNLKTRLGDSELKATMYYIRTGDASRELRASNDTDMNVGTVADGGYAVPTGHYQGIIAKRNELMLAGKLGVRPIPGQGTTVNVPTESGTANEFVSTNEAAAFDRDAPALGRVQMTLVKYTKKVQMSYELLQDEDSAIQAFLDDYIGRAMAVTHNKLLVTEALANGTSNTLANASAVAAGDVTELVYALKGEYADGAQWIMKRATEGLFRTLTGNAFQFAPTPAGTPGATLWGFPINNSEQVPAVATTAKSVIFGNFNYVGFREAPGFTFLRDPYSSAGNGQVNLFYYFRTVYKVLQAEAIQYGVHP